MSSDAQAGHDHHNEGLWDAHNEPHEHLVVPWQTLLGVLLVLLFFTLITVNFAQFERFAAYEWGWVFPGWVNIVVALLIAGVKCTFVVMYFMQLRWDKGLNVVLLLFTLFAVMLFLMFTAIDLTGRDRNIEWRAGEVVPGGTGYGIMQGGETSMPANTSIVEAAKASYQAKKGYTEEEWAQAVKDHKHDHGHHHEPDAVVRTGLTPGLFADELWPQESEDGHGHEDDHDDHGEDDHGDDHD